MRIDTSRLHAVVTGDVVASSALTGARREALADALTATASELTEAWPDALLGQPALFRGDGWQMALKRPEISLRCALAYRASLRARMRAPGIDVRCAIGLGAIDFIPANRVSQGDGEAFRLSGQGLEAMRRGEGMRLHFPACPEESALDTVVRLIDALAARWSDRQALAVTGALRGWAQEEIGRRCWPRPISQQAVQQHLDRAAWSGIEAGLEYFETTVSRWAAHLR